MNFLPTSEQTFTLLSEKRSHRSIFNKRNIRIARNNIPIDYCTTLWMPQHRPRQKLTWICSDSFRRSVSELQSIGIADGDLPSHGSGTLFAARSSMENLISCPFSSRVSGSAFMSQYCLSDASSIDRPLVSDSDLIVFCMNDIGQSVLRLSCFDFASI